MSGLNKSKNTIFKFLILYFIIAVAVTGYFIYFYKQKQMTPFEYYFGKENENVNAINEQINIDSTENYGIKSLSNKYFLNNLNLEVIKEERGEIIKSEWSEDYKFTCRYVKVNGLKNKQVENKINNWILEKVEEYTDEEEINDSKIKNIIIYCDVNANYSNIFSLSISKSISYKENGKYENDSVSAAFRLDTGEILKFEDIFTDDASIKNIIAQSYYEQASWQYVYGQNSEGMVIDEFNMEKIDYAYLENETLEVVKSYEKNKDNVEFYLSYDGVVLYIEDMAISVEFEDFYKYIAIYNKYLSNESLYENGNLEKLDYVCAFPLISCCDYFKQISENTFLAIFNESSYNEKVMRYAYNETDDSQYYAHYSDANYNKIIEYVKKDNMNSKKSYIYNVTTLSENYETQDDSILVFMEKVEVDADNFEKEIDKIYSEAVRKDRVSFELNLGSSVEDEQLEYIKLEEIDGKLIKKENY